MITLQNECLQVEISEVGGQITSIKDKKDQTEFLWSGDPTYWKGQAPNLFPYIGRLVEGKYIYKGTEYQLTKHGFARDLKMDVLLKSDDRVTFSLGDNEKTLEMYPFHFHFMTSYRLVGRMIQITFTVENKGKETMYFGVGGHPGFNVPLERGFSFEDYYLEFAESSKAKQIDFSDDMFALHTATDYELVDGKRIPLHHDLFDRDAVVLKDVAKSVTLKANGAKHQVTVQYPDMAYVGFWHMDHTDAPYVCIEPWSSLPAYSGVVTDLEKQDNLISLEAGKTYENRWSISCE